MSLWQRTLERWFVVDPRALAVFRIALASLVIIDVLRRISFVDMFYIADGIMLPPDADKTYSYSLLMHIDTAAGVFAFFSAILVAAVGLLLGWRTRVMQVLCAVGVLSLHGTYYPHNGGDVLMNHLLVWSAFLPLGRVLSLDARRVGADFGLVRSPAMLALIVQLGVVYFFGGIHKSGVTWADGHGIYYTLQLDSHATGLGVWLRDFLSLEATAVASAWVQWAEIAALFLLLSPLAAVWCRRLVLLGLAIPLHVGLLATFDVGLFQPTILTLCILMVPWEDVARLAGKPATPWTPATPGGIRAASHALLGALATANLWAVLALNPWSAEQLVAAGYTPSVPAPINQVLRVTNSFQKWAMFGPEVDTGENRLAVLGRTGDGRVLDLLTGEAPYMGPNTHDTEAAQTRAHPWSEFWRKYIKRLSRTDDQRHADRLGAWALSRHNARVDVTDQIVDVPRVFLILDVSPPPGEGGEAWVRARIHLKRR